MLIWLLIIGGVVALDQATKALLMVYIPNEYDCITVIPEFFQFKHYRNTGVAFGSFDGANQRWMVIIVPAIGLIALLIYLWKFRPKSKLACTALSMVIGGGIGNMIDRCVRLGDVYNSETKTTELRYYVFDFIDFCAFPNLWHFPFNVADIFVCVGAGMLMAWCIYSFVVEVKAEKAKKLENEIFSQDSQDKADELPSKDEESGGEK